MRVCKCRLSNILQMIKISNRLKCIANQVGNCGSIADIGTDHGKLPIYLLLKGKIKKAILSDLNEGPLKIANDNIKKANLEGSYEIRLSDGLERIHPKEVECIVIAGMGGLLICDILEKDIIKSHSFDKIILQPRNSEDKMRRWLFYNDFEIINEELVREGKYICQVMTVISKKTEDTNKNISKNINKSGINEYKLEISPILFKKSDPLLSEFIIRKIKIENNIINELNKSIKLDKVILIAKSKERVLLLEKLLTEAKEKR